MLQAAAGAVRDKGLKGSATVCIVTVDVSRGLLKCTNLGDSGFLVLRNNPETLEVRSSRPNSRLRTNNGRSAPPHAHA